MDNKPPKAAQRLLLSFLRSELAEEVQGDLDEKFYKTLRKRSLFHAKLNYWYQVLSYMRPFAIRKCSPLYLNHSAMFQHYFKISWRNILKNKAYSFINVTGLSLGLACCMLIFLYAKDEITYDRFHAKKDQIYQLTYTFWNLESNEKHYISTTNISAGEGFESDIPEIEEIVRMSQGSGLVLKGTEPIAESFFYVDDNFFSVFSFPLIHGAAKTAFYPLNSVVLSEEAAVKYFGTTDVLGRELQIRETNEFKPFVVSAVAKNVPENSSLKFHLLLPFKLYKNSRQINADDWFSGYLNTFLVLHPEADPVAVEAKFADVLHKHAGETLAKANKQFNMRAKIIYGLQPFVDIHLARTFKGSNGISDTSDPVYSYLMSALAIFILVIACFNFVNLSIAQSLRRAREIGIRKTYGNDRMQIVKQFLGESFLISLLAFFLAFLIALLVLPVFNDLANKKLSLSYLLDGYLIGGYLLLLMLTSLAAGSYPAWILSGFNPIKALSGGEKLTGRHAFSKSLVVVQFTLSSLLIIATFTIYSQINYLLTRDLGYDDKNLIRISLPGGEEQAENFKNELKKSSNVVNATVRSKGFNYRGIRVDDKEVRGYDFKVDEHYLSTLGISIKEGRNFSSRFLADSSQSVIINEAFAREAGWGENPIGQTLAFMASDRKYTVVGVVNDYHFRPLNVKIEPMLLHMFPHTAYGEVLVKIRPEHLSETVVFLQQTFKKLEPVHAFDYEFVDIANARQYQVEERWKRIMSYGSILAVLISCVGLFGLASLSIQQRTKEIGIRKVLGASISSIVAILSQNFFKLVLVSFLIAVPLGLYSSYKWLQNFAYRIEVKWWMISVSGGLILLLSLLIITFQSARAARSNPVNCLRSE